MGDANLSWANKLYIPLCLYFNCPASANAFSIPFLYIPLCLYFNVNVTFTVPAAKYFTFHYVFILICANNVETIDNCTFTFHYVSILMETEWQWLSSKRLYIPLCLYFNPKHGWRRKNALTSLHSIMSLF